MLLTLVLLGLSVSLGHGVLDPDYYDTHDCPNGWTLHQEQCYWIDGNEFQYEDAKENCQRRHAKLATIGNGRTYIFLTELRDAKFEVENLWLGLKKDAESNCAEGDTYRECLRGDWFWQDGTSYSFQHWEMYEPSNNNELCGYLARDWWKAYDCNAYAGYICQKDSLVVTRPYITEL